jgi:hypothetical protein
MVGCTAFAYGAPEDVEVYRVVIDDVASADDIEPGYLSATLARERFGEDDDCDRPWREWMLATFPAATPALLDDFCRNQRRAPTFLSPRRRLVLSRAVPVTAGSERGRDELQVSTVGYDHDGRLALALVVVRSEFGVYYLLTRTNRGWQVLSHSLKWIS